MTSAEREALRVAIDAARRGRLGIAADGGPLARREWTADEILDAIDAFRRERGRLPERRDLVPPRMPSARTVGRHFGGVRGALAAFAARAGYEVVEPERLFAV